MTKQQPWFVEERAFAFAALLLTKNDDVAVRPYAGRDMAINLLAEILKDGNATSYPLNLQPGSDRRFFGVQLVGYLDLPTIQNADAHVFSHAGRDPFEAGLPLCAFVIGVRKPEGVYRWIVEPVVDNGRAILRPHVLAQREVETRWQSLDDAGTERLIGQVNAYYDALNAGTHPKPHRHNSKTRR